MTIPDYVPNPQATTQDTLIGLIDYLSAYIEQFHNGFVRVVSIEGDVLTVELGGRCESCTLSMNTLHGWIAGTVRQFFPTVEVVGVTASTGEPINV
jgi:Fe-S cluster biogenesis protein NfuA